MTTWRDGIRVYQKHGRIHLEVSREKLSVLRAWATSTGNSIDTRHPNVNALYHLKTGGLVIELNNTKFLEGTPFDVSLPSIPERTEMP
jgi:hypothetical protein